MGPVRVHLLSAGVGALAGVAAAVTRNALGILGVAVCGHILLFQLTTLIPPPTGLLRLIPMGCGLTPPGRPEQQFDDVVPVRLAV